MDILTWKAYKIWMQIQNKNGSIPTGYFRLFGNSGDCHSFTATLVWFINQAGTWSCLVVWCMSERAPVFHSCYFLESKHPRAYFSGLQYITLRINVKWNQTMVLPPPPRHAYTEVGPIWAKWNFWVYMEGHIKFSTVRSLTLLN